MKIVDSIRDFFFGKAVDMELLEQLYAELEMLDKEEAYHKGELADIKEYRAEVNADINKVLGLAS